MSLKSPLSGEEVLENTYKVVAIKKRLRIKRIEMIRSALSLNTLIIRSSETTGKEGVSTVIYLLKIESPL